LFFVSKTIVLCSSKNSLTHFIQFLECKGIGNVFNTVYALSCSDRYKILTTRFWLEAFLCKLPLMSLEIEKT